MNWNDLNTVCADLTNHGLWSLEESVLYTAEEFDSSAVLIEKRGRLLTRVNEMVSICERCDRCAGRSREFTFDALLNKPVFVMSHSHIEDSLTGRLCTGMREVIDSGCATCVHVGNHHKWFTDKRERVNSKGQNLPVICQHEPIAGLKTNDISDALFSSEGENRAYHSYGQVLQRLFLDVGIKREEVNVLSSVVCPATNAVGEFQVPSKREEKACLFWIDLQLRLIEPPLVILMGQDTLALFFGKEFSFGEVQGKSITHRRYGNVGVITNPGYLLRQKDTSRAASLYSECAEYLESYFAEEL